MKSVADCLDFIDNTIFYDIEKADSMESLESMRDYFLDDYIKRSDKELVAIMSILSRINLIINRFYIPDDYCITEYYYDLRKRTIAWKKLVIRRWKMIINNILSQLRNKRTLLLKITYTKNPLPFLRKLAQNREYIQTFCMSPMVFI